MTCPDCKHPIDKHTDFYCLCVNCKCNNSRSTAKALAERDELRRKLDTVIAVLKSMNMWDDEYDDLVSEES